MTKKGVAYNKGESSTEGHRTNKNGKPSPTYYSWISMKGRCNYKNGPDYKRYGGRGIKICKEWEKDFLRFLKDMGERPEGTSLDRIDNDGNYNKKNCRWATVKEQSNNRRNNKYVLLRGKLITLTQAVEKYAVVNGNCVEGRLHRGWRITNALFTPLDTRRIKKTQHRPETPYKATQGSRLH